MHVACSFGNLVAAQALHQRRASVDVLDSRNHTPLWDALDCSKGRQQRRHLVEYLLQRAGLVQRLRSQSSALVAHALTMGTTETAALVLQQLRAETTPVVVPHAAWMVAAERVTVDDPLLEHLPVGRSATVKALGQVWKGRREAVVHGRDAADFCRGGVHVKDAHLLLADTPATKLLRRVCKDGSLEVVDDKGNTLLHHATRHGGLPEVSLLLKNRASSHIRNVAGDLPLHIILRHYAPSRGLANVVEQLIGRRVDLKAQDSAGVPPICRAAAAGNEAVVELLLNAGADPAGTDSCGQSALHHVAAGSIEQVAAVRERDRLQPALEQHRAATDGALAALSARRPRRATADRVGESPRPVSLFQALQELSVAFANIIKLLVARGASVMAVDELGSTPLHAAAMGAKVDILMQLVDQGADVQARNLAFETPLHVAARSRSTQTLHTLVKKGAPCEAEDHNGRTPLHYACYYSSSEVIAEMCRLQANVNHIDRKRRTPLHVVVCRAHSGTHAYGRLSLPSCKALVQHNAKVNEPDFKMRTPLLLAYMHRHIRVAHYLWDHGAHPEQSYGLHTLLFREALAVADIALVKYLLQHSRTLEIHHKDPSGLTFLEGLTKQLAKFPFLAYSACMDELLGRRVPITLAALVDIWSHISTWATRIRWTIDEEFTPAHTNPSGSLAILSPGSPRTRLSASLASLADLDALNSRTAPGSSVKAAAVPTSLMTISTGSNIRSSAGASRLAPVSEDEDEESPTYVAAKIAPGVPGMLEEGIVIEEGEEGESGSDVCAADMVQGADSGADRNEVAVLASGHIAPAAGLTDGAVDMSGIELGNAGSEDVGRASLGAVDTDNAGTWSETSKEGDAHNAAGSLAKAGRVSSFDTLPSSEVRSWQPRQRLQVSSGLSKSLGAAAVSKVLASKSWSVGGSSVAGADATSMAVEEEVGDEVDVENLMTTPSGLKSLRWSVALGEELAHGCFPFMPRQMHIESLRAALRVSSMALVQWRTQANSAEARLSNGGTALHAAVQHEVRLLCLPVCFHLTGR
eukprot:jgi/Ulvmu1/7534/UM037_0078.1